MCDMHGFFEMVDAYNRGWEAFELRQEALDNPHLPGTELHIEWAAGYRDAKEES